MKQLIPTDDPFELTGAYGQEWTTGVVTDHEHLFTGSSNRNRFGERVLVGLDGSVPVLCGELIWIDTEDGKVDGRCGLPVNGDDPACPGHARMMAEAMQRYEEDHYSR